VIFCVQLDNWPTNQLAVSQVADWSTRELVNSTKCLIKNLEYVIALSVISGRCHNLYAVNNLSRLGLRLGLDLV